MDTLGDKFNARPHRRKYKDFDSILRLTKCG